MLVRDVMQADVVSVRAEDTVQHLDEVLSRKRITGAPVLEDGRVIGVVSRTDVVRQLEVERSRFEGSSWYLEPFDTDEAAGLWRAEVSEAVAARMETWRVRDLMTKEVRSIAPDAPLQEAARELLKHKVHRLVVMEGGALVGLLSTMDVLRGFCAEDA